MHCSASRVDDFINPINGYSISVDHKRRGTVHAKFDGRQHLALMFHQIFQTGTRGFVILLHGCLVGVERPNGGKKIALLGHIDQLCNLIVRWHPTHHAMTVPRESPRNRRARAGVGENPGNSKYNRSMSKFGIVGLLVGVASGLFAQEGMVPADIPATHTISESRISPDGMLIIFAIDSKVKMIPAGGGQAKDVEGVPKAASSFRWSPDGTKVAFFGEKDNKSGIYLLTKEGVVTRVCDYDHGNGYLPHAGNALAWSPDGTQIAFAGTTDAAPAKADPVVVTRILYKSRTSFSDNRRTHIYVVAVGGGTPRAVTSGDHDEHSIDWGGTGEEIVYLSNREPDPDARLNYDIYAAEVASGKERRITQTPGVELDPKISPDGKLIAYIATTRPITTIDSIAEDAHVWVVPIAGGKGREWNAALDRRSSAPQWMADNKSVVYIAGDHGKSVLYKSTGAGPATAIVNQEAQVMGVSLAEDGTLAMVMSKPDTLGGLYVLRPKGKPTELTASESHWKLSKAESFTFRSFDGTPVQGFFYPALPGTALQVKGRSPMILAIHGGPHGAFGYAFNAAFQMYAAHGYAVVAINPRGSTGYGQKFSDGTLNNWGGGDYKDLMAGVDYILKNHPEIDGNRLGVTGGSYGGFMTNWVITQTDRFKAAVAVASVSDMVSFYATSLYQDLVHAEFSGFPWAGNNYETLWKWSPLAHVKNVKTPTMFLHGENDNDVHITQAEEMYTALRQRGIAAEMVRYPREGHGFREPAHRVDAAQRTLDWMDKYLGESSTSSK